MNTDTPSSPERSDFIRDIVAADLRDGRHRVRRHALPARAQRLPPHRPREVDLPELRHRAGVRRPLPPALRRHEPGQGGAGVHRLHRGRRPLARLRLGRAPLLRLGLLRAALRVGRPPHQGRQGLRRRPLRRGDPRAPRHAHRARHARARGATARPRRASTCSSACAPASSRTGRACCAPRSTWPRRNINLRDPVIYRIVHAEHPRTGDAWCVYPTYDFAHGQSDAIEGITHSICTLEFQDHRPLYDWFIENLPVPSRPHQYEFARLNLTHTVLSKRVLLRLVNEGHVRGWDDPRMPTLSGLRRRGFPAEGIRDFAAMIGVARADSVVEVEMLEHAVRDVLNRDGAPPLRGPRSRSRSSSRTTPRARSRRWRRPTTPRTRRRALARCPSRGSSGSSATTSWRTRRRSSSASPPAARCGCARRTSSPATRS